jgi:DNA ligase (NAD+)
LEKIDGESAWRCPSQLCSAQIKERLEYYASRGCMNIDHLGEAVIAQLVDRGYVKELSDLYMLSNEQLLQLDGFAQKSADNLLVTIDKSKSQVLWRFICGLGIKHVGTSASKELAREFGSIQSLEHASEEELTSISGVGSIMAKSIFSFFQNLENQAILRKLEELGLQFNSIQGEPKKKLSLDGKTFVLTGTLKNFTREEAGSRIESLGGRVSSSISKKTTFLLAGKGGGSKLSKAQKLDVPILSEDEFSLLIET